MRRTAHLLLLIAGCWLALPARAEPVRLIEVYQQARVHDRTLAAAEAEQAARAEQVPQARAALLPQLEARLSLSDTRLDDTRTLQRSGTLYQLTLSQALLRADRWFALQAAESGSRQAALQRADSEQQLILRSAEAYLAVLQAEDELAASRAEERAAQQQLLGAQARLDTGLGERTALLEAQAARDSARASRLDNERALIDAHEALETLSGRAQGLLAALASPLPLGVAEGEQVADWVDTARQRNLALKASAAGVEVAGQTLRQRNAAHAPSFELVAQHQEGDRDRLVMSSASTGSGAASISQQSLSLQLTVPLYSGGLTSAQSREARQRLLQSEALHEGLQRDLIEQVRTLYRAVSSANSRLEARAQALRSRSSALHASELGYQLGTRTLLDVLDARRQQFAALRQYQQVRYASLLDQLRLRRAAGLLTPDDLLQLHPAQVKAHDPQSLLTCLTVEGADDTAAPAAHTRPCP